MRMRLLDALVCPKCRAHPLKLLLHSKEKREILRAPEGVLCKRYCSFKGGEPSNTTTKDCRECMSTDVVVGELVCEACGARYRISEGVPCL